MGEDDGDAFGSGSEASALSDAEGGKPAAAAAEGSKAEDAPAPAEAAAESTPLEAKAAAAPAQTSPAGTAAVAMFDLTDDKEAEDVADSSAQPADGASKEKKEDQPEEP